MAQTSVDVVDVVDVAVVGAGIAGLVAARDLTRAGRDVLVLEARDRVGGRLVNGQLPDGCPIELGGQWVGPGQDQVHQLLPELGLDTFPTYDDGRHIAELGGRRSEYTGRIPRLNPLVLADIQQGQWRLDRLVRRFALEEPWRAAGAERLDGQAFATWLRRTVYTAGGRSFYRLITGAIFCAEPEDLSALWASCYIGSAGGLDRLINTKGGAQQDRIAGGSQRIAEVLAGELGERVRLGAPVTDVEWTARGVQVSTATGLRVRAGKAIITLPPALAARLRYHPALPADRDQLVSRMPMGRVIKVNVSYPEPFWRTAGFSGQANSDRRAVGTVFDNTVPGSALGVLVGFLEGRHADAAARLDPAQRRERVLADLAGYFGPQAHKPAGFLELDWAAEEYSRGCYAGFATPGTLSRFGPALRAPIGPLHWAGTETATKWIGYIDGAIESGHRAARETTS